MTNLFIYLFFYLFLSLSIVYTVLGVFLLSIKALKLDVLPRQREPTAVDLSFFAFT